MEPIPPICALDPEFGAFQRAAGYEIPYQNQMDGVRGRDSTSGRLGGSG
jgi:hypothetical protein